MMWIDRRSALLLLSLRNTTSVLPFAATASVTCASGLTTKAKIDTPLTSCHCVASMIALQLFAAGKAVTVATATAASWTLSQDLPAECGNPLGHWRRFLPACHVQVQHLGFVFPS